MDARERSWRCGGAWRGAVAASVLGLAAGTAAAQPAIQKDAPAAEKPASASVAELLANGFEIKGVSFLSLDAAKRINAEIETEAFVVTLQRGPSLAVCFVSLPGWTYLREGTTNSSQNCDLRTFTPH